MLTSSQRLIKAFFFPPPGSVIPTQSFGSRLLAWAGALCDSSDHMVYLICQFLSTGLDDIVLHLSSLRHLSCHSHCQGGFTPHRVDVKPAGLLGGDCLTLPPSSPLSSLPVTFHTFTHPTLLLFTLSVLAQEQRPKSTNQRSQKSKLSLIMWHLFSHVTFQCCLLNVGFQWLP